MAAARVLLVGGSGLLGAPAARTLRDAGHDVTVVSRGRRGVVDGVRHESADRADAAAFARAAGRGPLDLVVDFLAYGGDGTVQRVLDRLAPKNGDNIQLALIGPTQVRAEPFRIIQGKIQNALLVTFTNGTALFLLARHAAAKQTLKNVAWVHLHWIGCRFAPPRNVELVSARVAGVALAGLASLVTAQLQ